jgi:hypothetical protein
MHGLDGSATDFTSRADAGTEQPFVDPGAEDRFEPFSTASYEHAALMDLLMGPRKAAREAATSEIQQLAQRRNEALQRASLAAQGANHGGGRGGLLGGLGGLFRGNPLKAVGAETAALDERMRSVALYRSAVLDRQYESLARAVNGTYQTHAALKQTVRDFNQRFSSSPEGKAYLDEIVAAGQSLKLSPAEVQDAIHSGQSGNPVIENLRQQSAALSTRSEWGGDIARMEELDRVLKLESGRITDDFARLKENGDKFGLDLRPTKGVADILEGLETDSSLLSRPDGSRLHRLAEDTKTKFAEIAQKMREIIEAILRFVGLSR